jgi:hypothetical protein
LRVSLGARRRLPRRSSSRSCSTASSRCPAGPIHSVDEARFAKDRQYDFVKVYDGLRAAEFDAIVDESRKARLAVIGHGSLRARRASA